MFRKFKKSISDEQRTSPAVEAWLQGTDVDWDNWNAESLSPDASLKESTVMGCVRVLSESVSQLPLGLFQGKRTGKRTPVTMHPSNYLMNDRPNDVQTPFEFREFVMNHAVLSGNFYAKKKQNNRGTITQLTPINPNHVQPFVYTQDGRSSYQTLLEGGRIAYRDNSEGSNKQIIVGKDMLHVRGMTVNGFVGISPIGYQRETINLALMGKRHGYNFLKKGARPSGIVTHPKTLSEIAIQNVRASFNRLFSGIENVGDTIVLSEGASYVPAQINNRDAQYLESRQFSKIEICAFFRVPPHMIADLTRATFNNIEHLSLNFVVHVLGPWLARLENTYDLSLLSQLDRDKGLFWDHNVKGLLRGDNKARSQFYQSGIQSGWLSRNEARDMEGLNPKKGADALLVPLNMADIGDEPEEVIEPDVEDIVQEEEEKETVDTEGTDEEQDS